MRSMHLGGVAAVAAPLAPLAAALSGERLTLQREMHAAARHSKAYPTYQSLVRCDGRGSTPTALYLQTLRHLSIPYSLRSH